MYLSDVLESIERVDMAIVLYGSGNTPRALVVTSEDLDDDGYYAFRVRTDGIYQIIITVGNTDYYFYIFEYCQTEQCYLRLLNDIYCNDVDCCTGCSDEVIRDRMFKRNELAKLRMYMDEISFGIMHMRVSTVGVEGDSIDDVIVKLKLYYDRIQEITARCGTCSDTTPVSSPCNNCGQ